jgi:hypothetical protein
MGLDISHGCWDGAYSAFHRWRKEIAHVAGMPPLELMAGFYTPLSGMKQGKPPTLYHGMGTGEGDFMKELDRQLPIPWEALKPDALHELLNHSDCDGEIPWGSCKAIADRLSEVLSELPDEDAGGHIGNWRAKTSAFIKGLLLAFEQQENIDFH